MENLVLWNMIPVFDLNNHLQLKIDPRPHLMGHDTTDTPCYSAPRQSSDSQSWVR